MVKPHSSLGYKPPVPATVVIQPSHIQQVSLTLLLVHILGGDPTRFDHAGIIKVSLHQQSNFPDRH